MSEKDIVVITHGNCCDGFCSYAVLARKFGDRIDSVFHVEYGKNDVMDGADFKDKHVFISDYSFNKDDSWITGKIAAEAKSVTLIDHHDSSLEWWGNGNEQGVTQTEKTFNEFGEVETYQGTRGNLRVILDKRESGASLVWKNLFPSEPIPDFVKYVREGDLFKMTSIESRAFDNGLKGLKKDLPLWLEFLESDEKTSKVIADAMSETEVYEKLCSTIAATARPVVITLPDGSKEEGMFVVCPNIVRNRVSEMIYEETNCFVALLTEMDSKQVKISLRARNAPDGKNVRVIAEAFGMGGHNSAAALRLSKEQYAESFAVGETLSNTRKLRCP